MRIGPSFTAMLAGCEPSASTGPISPPGMHGATRSRSTSSAYVSAGAAGTSNVCSIFMSAFTSYVGKGQRGGQVRAASEDDEHHDDDDERQHLHVVGLNLDADQLQCRRDRQRHPEQHRAE